MTSAERAVPAWYDDAELIDRLQAELADKVAALRAREQSAERAGEVSYR